LLTAVLFHQNFAIHDELLHFEKDLAIAGGMFVLMVRGAGTWSIDALSQARGRDGIASMQPQLFPRKVPRGMFTYF
jgi:putative oxidoreductase